ncbi:unnamed protein product [Closterium sp. NIES-54]
MDITRTSMIHARAPHFLWPYAVRYAAHQLNLQPRGCLALVRNTSADKLSARAVPYIFLGFPVAMDSGGVGAGGAAPGGAQSRGARLRGTGTGGTGTRGVGSGGAGAGGAGAGGADTGAARFGGAGVGGLGIEGARSGGAGAGDLDPGGTPYGDTGTGGASFEETRSGGTTSVESTPPPHHHDTRYQVACQPATTTAATVAAAAAATAAASTAASVAAAAAATTAAIAAPFGAAVDLAREWPLGPWSSLLSFRPLSVSPCSLVLRFLLLMSVRRSGLLLHRSLLLLLSVTTIPVLVLRLLVPRPPLPTSTLHSFVLLFVVLLLRCSFSRLLLRLLFLSPLLLSLSTAHGSNCRHLGVERHGGARDEDGGGVGANDAAAHGRVAPLVAPHSTPGTTPYQLLTGKKPDLSLARVWGCLAQFLVPEQQRGGKLKPKARWSLHLDVSEDSKGWELLDIADNRVVTTSHVVFYENISLEVWKSEHKPASSWTPTTPPTGTSTATLPLLAEVSEPTAEDVEDVPFPSPSLAPCVPPLVADLRGLTPVSASGDEGRSGTSPSAPAKSIAGGRRDEQQVDVGVKSTLIGENQAEEVQPTLEKPAKKAPAGQQPTGEQAAVKPTTKQSAARQSAEEPTTEEKSAVKPAEVQQDDEGSEAGDDGGDDEESTDSDVVEVQRGPRQSGRIRRPPDFYVPAVFTTAYDEVDDDLQYDDAEEDEDFPELDPDMHANLEHRWGISMMTVKEALASWKGKAVKAAMEEEICSLFGMGTWELVERPPGVNITKNQWVLMTKYHIDDIVEREKARLVVKGFMQVYGADYDEMYAPNAFLQSKLDRVLYMYQPDYFNDGTGWKKSQVDTALYFKFGDDKVTCWVLVYVDDLLAASSSAAMVKELKELLEAAFELREILPVQKYLGLEIVRNRLVRKLWVHQQGYADKLRRRFFNEEQNRHTPKTPVSVDAYAPLTFNDEEAQEREEEEYRQKIGLLQFAATTTRPDIAFVCSKLGSGLTSLKLVGYVDADEAGDKQNRTSTGGYVFVFGGAAVSWSSQRIKCTTLSSTESEYVAATEADKEGRRLPPCKISAAGRRDADCPSGGQQVGHHSRRGHGVDGQPQAHGLATSLAATHGEAWEVFARVHPDR